MAATAISKESFIFLDDLAKHNNRDWFQKNKDRYLSAQANIVLFADALLEKMQEHDNIQTASGKKSLFRIYRDVRFAKEKTPYNTHWSGSFKRATRLLRGGYYFHLKPGHSFLAGGFWGPNPQDMKRIRSDIDSGFRYWKKMLANKKMVQTFGSLRGEKVPTVPRGFNKDHPAIDLLRHKQFLLQHNFSDKEVLGRDFVGLADSVFKDMRPFLNFMSEVLTTDTNGEMVSPF
jgi:uncharacterized protein (TIGR02453 family)